MCNVTFLLGSSAVFWGNRFHKVPSFYFRINVEEKIIRDNILLRHGYTIIDLDWFLLGEVSHEVSL